MGSDIGGYIRLRISRVRHLRLRTTLSLVFLYFFMAALLVIGLCALLGTLVEIIPSFPGTQPLRS